MERDENDLKFVDTKINFNSHAHVERDHHVELTDGGKYNFNSHAHVERDLEGEPATMQNVISTHTLTWSVTSSVNAMTTIASFQLTRSRGA